MPITTETRVMHEVSSTLWDGGPRREHSVTLPLSREKLGITYSGVSDILRPYGATKISGHEFDRAITFVLEPGYNIDGALEVLKPYLMERYQQSFAGPITMEFRRVCSVCGS